MILPQGELFDNSRKHPKRFSSVGSDKFSGRERGIITGMKTLYLDLWFGLNLLCDYLLCLVTARAAGLRLKRKRYLGAALLGALQACAAFLPGFSFLSSIGWKLLGGLAIGLLAFGSEKHPVRCILLFFAVSAAFGGTLLALSGGRPIRLSLYGLLSAFLLCYGIGTLLFRCQTLLQERQILPVSLRFGGRCARFPALRDTGNTLRDPLSGAKILIVSPTALHPIFLEDTALFQLDPVELQALSTEIPLLAGRLRLLPYSAVGGSGLLPIFAPEELWIDGKENHDCLVAVSSQVAGDGYEAIL